MVRQSETWVLRPGQKAVSLDALPDSAWTWYNRPAGEDDAELYVKSVPWLARAIEMRAQALSGLPFVLVDVAAEKRKEAEEEAERLKPKPEPKPQPVVAEDGAVPPPEAEEPEAEAEEPPKPEIVTEYDTSENWENKCGFMPDPAMLLWQVEASLVIHGCAYLLRDRTARRTLGLRYLLPTSIEPVIDSAKGLVGFIRHLGSKRIELKVEDLVYFWTPDAYTEIGPSNHSPVAAALSAAGVLYEVDRFATGFFKSGAIRATLLKVPPMSSTEERNRLKAWWRRVFTGSEKAHTTEVISSEVETEQIGDGIDGLADTQLIGSKREDIATALGVPHSLLFSNASNFATAQQDDLHFYSKTIVPEAQFVAGVLNQQVFAPLNLRWEFRPETLDAYQEDETQRAQAFKTYCDAGLKLSVAAQMMGLELPPGVEYDDLDEDKPEPVLGVPGMPPTPGVTPPAMEPFAQATESAAAAPQKSAAMAAMEADLRRWRDKARKANGVVPFDSEFIPPELKAGLEHDIELCGVEDAFAFLKKKRRDPYIEPEDVANLRARVQKKLQPVLNKYRPMLLDAIEGRMDIEPILAEMEAELKGVLLPELTHIITQQALWGGTVGVVFDAAILNQEAIDWARRYTFELVRGLTDTTRKLLQSTISAYFETPGMTRGQLESLISPAFGPVRSEMIATTEVTRAYSEATNEQQRMLAEAGIQMRRVWLTLNDEMVCPVCGPLHDTAENVWRGQFPGGPPAHPNCRCSAELEVVPSGSAA